MLGAIAMQPTAEGTTLVEQQLAAMATANAPGQRTFSIMSPGVNGFGVKPLLTVDLAPNDAQGQPMPTTWMDTGFKKLWVDSRIQVTGPFPSLQLVGRQGAIQLGPDGPRDTEGYISWAYNIDAIALASGDIGIVTQRKAMIDALAFWRAVRLDDSLGGLVQRCRPTRPLEPGGGGGAGDRGSTVMAARVSFEVMVVIPD
ncbi:MAG: hypothetical protein ACRDNK_21520 [Solirubrobacteraceae bacterium]